MELFHFLCSYSDMSFTNFNLHQPKNCGNKSSNGDTGQKCVVHNLPILPNQPFLVSPKCYKMRILMSCHVTGSDHKDLE